MAVVLAMSAVIGYGGCSVVAGTLSLGSLVAFYSFVTQLFDPLSGAAELYTRAQKTFASIRQLQGVCALRPTIIDPPICASFPLEDWGVEFVAVEFGYERQKNASHPFSSDRRGGKGRDRWGERRRQKHTGQTRHAALRREVGINPGRRYGYQKPWAETFAPSHLLLTARSSLVRWNASIQSPVCQARGIRSRVDGSDSIG